MRQARYSVTTQRPQHAAVTRISSEQLGVCSNRYQVPALPGVKYFVLHRWMETHILDSEVLPSKGILLRASLAYK